jgi:hypothetical protein
MDDNFELIVYLFLDCPFISYVSLLVYFNSESHPRPTTVMSIELVCETQVDYALRFAKGDSVLTNVTITIFKQGR